LLTFGLVVVGAFQVRGASQTAEISRLALQVNRPFLLVTELVNLKEQSVPDPFGFIVEADVALRNFGTGPADIIDYIVVADIYDLPPPDPDPDYDAMEPNELNNSVVAPNETATDKIHAIISLGASDYEIVQREQRRIGIHGRLRYRSTGDQVLLDSILLVAFPK